MRAERDRAGRGRRLAAWGVHILTASGAVLGFLALEAAWRADTVETFLWLGIALAVDGLDGPLARSLSIAQAEPRIDGAALDLIVDYLTYVVAPVAYFWSAHLFPAGWELPLAGLILMTSLYTFVRRDMKAEESDFRGFPAVWNLVAAALVVTRAGPSAVAATSLALAALTFAPVKVVHPVRVTLLRPVTLAVLVLWLAATGLLIAQPDYSRAAWLTAWWAATAYFLILCTARSLASK